ncbi:hypothetical protein [uncultured Lactobacillus sp.]|uniref:hypothetical protein n=1 Tax=uncultured Lactobacillus sp. TaxID=153152 RepID=UPI00260FDC06|nr:hypothetical protein [uncultured Lactobacillus sp.]
MKNINTRVMDYVVLVQDEKISIDLVPSDIKTDVIEIISYLSHGELKKADVSNE